MRTKIYFIILISSIILVACGDQSLKEASALYSESMEIHDAVMPRMDEIFKLKQALTITRDSLAHDSTSHAQVIREMTLAIDSLDMAQHGMMNWMHAIQDVPAANKQNDHHHHQASATAANQSPAEILRTQQNQKIAIEKVKASMERSIAHAEVLLHRVKDS